MTSKEIAKNRKHSRNDSRMILVKNDSPSKQIEIIPHSFSNIARFFNHDATSPNVKSCRVIHQKKPMIFLYTIKEINYGDELCYDYGKDYNTDLFNNN